MLEPIWYKNYDEGVTPSIDYPDITLQEQFKHAVQQFPDNACTIFKNAVITYQKMDSITDSIAAGLVDMGLQKGDRVGIFMANSPQFVMAFYGVLKAGGVVVATNPMYTPREIEHQANDSGMRFMFVMSNFYNKVKEIQHKTRLEKLIVTNLKETLPPVMAVLFTLLKEKKGGFRIKKDPEDVSLPELLAKFKGQPAPDTNIRPSDTAILQYTGGTTGIAKGAVGRHKGVVANSFQIEKWVPNTIQGKEVVLMAIPMYHAYGMIVGMVFAIRLMSPMVMVPDPRDVDDVISNLEKYKATIYPGVPAMYNSINNHPDVISGKVDVSSIKACISGSAPLMADTKNRFEGFTGGKLVEGYGLSETPVATHCNPILGPNKTGSIGMPFPDVQCRIVSLDDGETDLGIGEIGELLIKAPQVMKGYHNMPTETENALVDGWLYTGDIAYMDDDGFFFIVDRKKELIKPGGWQVWPREVEEVISLHPKVMECGVAGIPDAESGEAVKAWVVVRAGESLTKKEITDFCRESLAAYKVPKEIEFRGELPKTTVGKILRRELVREHKEQK